MNRLPPPITPDYAPHLTLEQRMVEFFVSLDFETGSATYHEAYAAPLKRLLQRNFEPTSLYIRAKADRIAVHRRLPLVFEYDAKTHENKQFRDCTLELLPVALHQALCEFDVRCLYGYHNPFTGHECGFWAHEFPPVRAIHLPSRWTGEKRSWFERMIYINFPNTPVRETQWKYGSGDPYLVIDSQVIDRLPHWQQLVSEALEEQSNIPF